MKTYNVWLEGEIVATFTGYCSTKLTLYFIGLNIPLSFHRNYGYEIETININQ